VALGDQLARPRGDDDLLEELAEAAVVEAPRRRGEADHGGVRVAVEDVAVRRGARVVRLVDDDQRRARQVVEPARQGRDRGDLHAGPRLAARVIGHDDPVVDPDAVEARRALLDQLAPVGEEEHVAVARDRALDDRPGDRRLAGAGRADEQHPLRLGCVAQARDRSAQLGARLDLVLAGHGAVQSRSYSTRRWSGSPAIG
jgi:hypothetical protein